MAPTTSRNTPNPATNRNALRRKAKKGESRKPRLGRRRWKQVAIRAEAACGGNVAVDDEKQQGETGHADQMRRPLVRNSRNSDEKSNQTHQDDQDHPGSGEFYVGAEVFSKNGHPAS